MSSTFNQNIMESEGRSGGFTWLSHRAHPHVKVRTNNGKILNIKSSQAITLQKKRITAHLKATGQYSNILSGGSVDIPIRYGSGFGHINNNTLRIDLRNDTGSALEMISDCGLWINYIEVLDANGTVIQNLQGKQVLFEMTDIYDFVSWECISD